MEPRDLARTYFERFPHDPSLVADALAPDFTFHHLRLIRGPEEFRTFMAGVSRAFPDFRFELHHLIAEGTTVAAGYTFTGTQRATFLERVPSRGRSFATRGASIFECSDRGIEQIWVTFNALDMLRQLGAIPEGESLP